MSNVKYCLILLCYAVLLLFSDNTAWLGRASAFSVLVDIRAGGEDLVLGQGEWGEVVNEEEKVEK